MKHDACPSCNDDRFSELFEIDKCPYGTTTERFAIVQCTSCGLRRLSPWPSSAELARYYPSGYWFANPGDLADRLASAYRRIVLSDHLRFVRRCLRECTLTGTFLDVGCGGGLLAGALRQEMTAAVGLDLSHDACTVAWSGYRVPSICGTLIDSPLKPGSCSAITMFHVLEHVYDPRRQLQAAHQLLCSGGWLIVQVPNNASWQSRLFGRRWNGLDVPRHLIDFRDSDLTAMLRGAGFEILHWKYFSLRDNPTGFASSLFPSLDPMVRRARVPAESPVRKLIKDAAYFGLAAASLPFALFEASCRAGATVMVGARKP